MNSYGKIRQTVGYKISVLNFSEENFVEQKYQVRNSFQHHYFIWEYFLA